MIPMGQRGVNGVSISRRSKGGVTGNFEEITKNLSDFERTSRMVGRTGVIELMRFCWWWQCPVITSWTRDLGDEQDRRGHWASS